jgi:PmbA protein
MSTRNLLVLDQCQQALDFVGRHGADEAEVFGQATRTITSAVEKDDLQISKSRKETRIGIRAFVGSQVGFASTNDLTRLEDASVDAVALAKASPGDPHNVLPEPRVVEPVNGTYDPAAESFTTADAVNQAIRILETARSVDSRVIVGEGEFSAEIRERVLVNSSGAETAELGSLFTYVVLTTARDGEVVSNMAFKFGATRSVDAIDIEPIARRASEDALGSLGAEKGKSFNGQVLLDPYAVLDLFGPLQFQLNARNALRGMSRWKDALGESIAMSGFSLVDDGRLPGGAATASFDREGVPHQRLPLIEGGVLRSFMHNAYTAHAFGVPNTGHATGSAGSLPAIGPTNFMILPGDVAKEDLISEMKQGLLVSRFSGNADPISGDFSGVAKAAYLIVDGKIDRAVSGTLIAGNVFQALKTLSGISRETESVFNYTLPSLRLERISITAE